MDEAQDLRLHRWLSGCRQLMLWHPRLGAAHAEAAVGLRREEMRPGWNRRDFAGGERRTLYTFIGDREGVTTTIPPDVDPERIHVLDSAPPPLSESVLWRELCEHAEALEASGNPPVRLRSVMASIERAGATDGIAPDRAQWSQRLTEAVADMRDAMRAGDFAGFVRPALDVARAYLGFELPGMLARDILAGLLSVQGNIPQLGSPAETSQAYRVAAIEWLADQTYTLLSERRGMNVTAHAEMTYLMMLYAASCTLLCEHATQAREPLQQPKRIARLAQGTEERAAHHAAIAFVLPALMEPAQVLAWVNLHSRRTRDPAATARYYALPPSLEALTGAVATSPERLTLAFQQDSALRRQRAVADELTGELSAIAPENQEKIVRDLLAMSFGRGLR